MPKKKKAKRRKPAILLTDKQAFRRVFPKKVRDAIEAEKPKSKKK